MAIAVGVIEADTFRRVAEPIGLFFGIEVNDRNVLVHRPVILLVAADGDVQIFVAFGFAHVCGNEAAFVGEGDALEVIGQGLADDIGDGGIGTGLPADVVGLPDYGSCSLVGTAFSMSLMISWVTSWRSHFTVSSVSVSFQSQYSSLL